MAHADRLLHLLPGQGRTHWLRNDVPPDRRAPFLRCPLWVKADIARCQADVRFGSKRTLRGVRPMSALPPKADIETQSRNVCFVPIADISTGVIRAPSGAQTI